MLLKLRNDRLIKIGKPKSVLSEDAAVGETEIDVLSGNGFDGDNKFVLIGSFGDENAEIVSFDSKSSNTLTVDSLIKNHPQNTPVYLIEADQVEFFHADSEDSSYSSLSKVDINPESIYTIYEDIDNSSGFGKARFYNSSSDEAYGGYHEIVKYDDDQRQTRGFAKQIALDDLFAEIDGTTITEDYLNRQITLCDDIIRQTRINWPEESYELTLLTELGITEYDASSYIKHSQIIDNILFAKIGDREVTPINRNDFFQYQGKAVKTYLAEDIDSTDNETITVTDATNLEESGSIMIEGDIITYTSLDKDTGVLSGVDDISELHSTTTSDGNTTEVWQNYDSGEPVYLTLINGKVHIYPVIVNERNVKNIQLTISKSYTQINDDSDELPFPVNLYILFLSYKIAKRRGDEDYTTLYEAFRNELTRYKIQQGSSIRRKITPGVVLYNPNRR